ncbi:ATP-binding protein [Xiamenia xianingshaonis]|uniref:ATP-binding protein n=1 Tax=Xiamenia xianingshaonis TaxID=2682776 RepID=UPI0013ED750D|nr:ATP-binding protein [Xiamenia xianingshaonis]
MVSSDFKAPAFICNDGAKAQYEQQELALIRRERIARSGIPTRFLKADLGSCDLRIQSYAATFDPHSSHSLFLRGDVGVGKTYSAAAILLAVAGTCPVRFASMGDILREVKATFANQGNESEVVKKYSGVSLLAVDDLGKEKPTAWALDVLFTIIDKRYSNNKTTIFTCQYSGAELYERLASEGDRETAHAIVSRLQEGQYIVLEGEDRRRPQLIG